AALGLESERERGDIDEQDVLAFTDEHTGLHGSTDRHDLIGVDALVGLLAAGEFGDHGGYGRHTGRTADEDDVVDVLDGHAGVLHDRVERSLGALEQVLGQVLELRTRQALIQVDGAVLAHRQVLQRDVRAGGRGQLLLGLLSGFLETLQSGRVLAQVDAVAVLDLTDEPVDDPLIPIIAAEAVVARGGADLNRREVVFILADFEQRDVEGAAAEVEDEN